MADTLVIKVTAGADDPERSNQAFTVAAAAGAAGVQVQLWLTGEAAWYALPGRADCRATLAAAVDDRLFFAGEACSRNDFSTAHGGWLTGVAAAEQAIAARARKRST